MSIVSSRVTTVRVVLCLPDDWGCPPSAEGVCDLAMPHAWFCLLGSVLGKETWKLHCFVVLEMDDELRWHREPVD